MAEQAREAGPFACLRAGLAAVEPGIEARAVEAPALAVLRDAGNAVNVDCVEQLAGAGAVELLSV